ncbi:MAG: hypothetical protein RL291_1429 [Pseudomonadota bacterium]
MLYLASKLWIWLLLGAVAGFVTAWLACSEVEDGDR